MVDYKLAVPTQGGSRARRANNSPHLNFSLKTRYIYLILGAVSLASPTSNDMSKA